MPSTRRLRTTGFTNSTAGCGTACGPRCRTRQPSTRPSKPWRTATKRNDRRAGTVPRVASAGEDRAGSTAGDGTRPRWAMTADSHQPGGQAGPGPCGPDSRPRHCRATRDGDEGRIAAAAGEVTYLRAKTAQTTSPTTPRPPSSSCRRWDTGGAVSPGASGTVRRRCGSGGGRSPAGG